MRHVINARGRPVNLTLNIHLAGEDMSVRAYEFALLWRQTCYDISLFREVRTDQMNIFKLFAIIAK